MELSLHVTEAAFCIICGKEVEDPNFQLCDTEECIERFRDTYLQGFELGMGDLALNPIASISFLN